MRVYSLTKLGYRVASGEGSGEEMRVLQKVRDMGRVRDDELMEDDTFVVRRLVKNGLVQELTT